jgi:hyperosmotically inducible periplasmic protein
MRTTNEYKQKFLANRILVMSCLSAVLGLAGCQQEGSAEKAGQKIDRAAENAEQKIEQATEKADQKIEAVKESLDQKSNKAGEYIEESTDASKEALEKAGKKLEGAKESIVDKAGTAGEFIDDSVITAKVKAAIMGSSWLSASHIDVTTVKGMVKLSGTVDSEQSITKAIEVASSEKNVKAVETDLIVNASVPSKE